MTTINCQDCKEQWEVSDETVPLGIQDGTYTVTRGHYGSLRYFGICSICRFGHKQKEVVPEDEFVKLYRWRDYYRARYPNMTLEEVCHIVVEMLNDPRSEPNPDYKAYLLEWIPRPEADEAIAA